LEGKVYLVLAGAWAQFSDFCRRTRLDRHKLLFVNQRHQILGRSPFRVRFIYVGNYQSSPLFKSDEVEEQIARGAKVYYDMTATREYRVQSLGELPIAPYSGVHSGILGYVEEEEAPFLCLGFRAVPTSRTPGGLAALRLMGRSPEEAIWRKLVV